MNTKWLGVLALCVSSLAHSEYQELDAIVAVVDDDVVLASELLARLTMVRESIARQNMQAPSDDVLVSQLMERLIVESIQLQQAERRGLTIDDETLTRAVAGVAEQNNMTLDQFREVLANDGMPYTEFREQIRREMVLARLQRGLVNRRIHISDQEIDDLLESPYYRQLLSDEFRVGHILLAVSDDAPTETVRRAQEKADLLVTQLRDGAEFSEIAIANSAGARALEGGDLGWRRAGELPTLFSDLVLKMEPGETAEPIRTGSGFHIIKLLEQRGAGMQRAEQYLARHILVRPSEIRTEEETEALINEIYQELVAGGDFEALAKLHSEDPGSALNGGDLGWAETDQFAPEFAYNVNNTPVGTLSKPFSTEYGWHVVEVLDHREEDMSDEARRNMAMQILHQRRFDEELQVWLQEIREEAFVEVRL
jgi:peptidyl-prolyl cis-trans isomerase SurA